MSKKYLFRTYGISRWLYREEPDGLYIFEHGKWGHAGWVSFSHMRELHPKDKYENVTIKYLKLRGIPCT